MTVHEDWLRARGLMKAAQCCTVGGVRGWAGCCWLLAVWALAVWLDWLGPVR